MASKVALAQKAERDRQALLDRIERLEQLVHDLVQTLQDREKPVPAAKGTAHVSRK